MALELVVVEVLGLVLVVQGLETAQAKVLELGQVCQGNHHRPDTLVSNQWCTRHHCHQQDNYHKCWHHPKHSSNIFSLRTVLVLVLEPELVLGSLELDLELELVSQCNLHHHCMGDCNHCCTCLHHHHLDILHSWRHHQSYCNNICYWPNLQSLILQQRQTSSSPS